jgi:hypothetical protein
VTALAAISLLVLAAVAVIAGVELLGLVLAVAALPFVALTLVATWRWMRERDWSGPFSRNGAGPD